MSDDNDEPNVDVQVQCDVVVENDKTWLVLVWDGKSRRFPTFDHMKTWLKENAGCVLIDLAAGSVLASAVLDLQDRRIWYAVRTIRDSVGPVKALIRRSDPLAVFGNQGNPATFWVKTTLKLQQLERISEDVEEVVEAQYQEDETHG